MIKRAILMFFALACTFQLIEAQSSMVSLDSCRAMAIRNNKELLISRERIKSADYRKREAFAAYLPAIDFAGGYLYNSKDISVFSEDQYLPVKTFNLEKGEYEFNLVTNLATGLPIQTADGSYVPSQVALMPKEALQYDIHNVFFGAVTLTQPVYMGGKIIAMNRITHYAEQLAQAQHNSEVQNVIYAVDAAYWQVVSLKAKYKLAQSYVSLLKDLSHNVDLMLEQGVATRSDQLSVNVKLNSAEVDLTKVENGLVLSRMALAQVCGLPVNTILTLADEDKNVVDPANMPATSYNMDQVFDQRQDIKALQLGIDILGQKKQVAKSEMLPNVALIGSYTFSTPNMFNGFSKHVSGMFSVGAMVSIPIWHWGGNYYKYKQAESDVTIMKLQMQDVREKVELQVSQASFKAQEAIKTYRTTQTNIEKANENLRQATLSFHEGVATTDNVMEAQTAWLKANSENVDAMIDVHLCDTYLSKVLGTLPY